MRYIFCWQPLITNQQSSATSCCATLPTNVKLQLPIGVRDSCKSMRSLWLELLGRSTYTTDLYGIHLPPVQNTPHIYVCLRVLAIRRGQRHIIILHQCAIVSISIWIEMLTGSCRHGRKTKDEMSKLIHQEVSKPCLPGSTCLREVVHIHGHA